MAHIRRVYPSDAGYKRVGKIQACRDPFQAAEMLTVSWPIDDGEEYLIAIRACRNAIHGEIPAQDARAALIRAADEAGIPVITVH